jgi:hypothetical protein
MDNYTKSVLTVIAACLLILTLNQVELLPEAQAASEPTVPASGNFGMVPLNENGEVPVSISNMEEVKVNIVGISTYWRRIHLKWWPYKSAG